ncbi:hypothetical protein ONE63_007093 [Megalurothrips usitatus]|uniref:Ribosomal protein S6 kinase delta-1 n=1 Tax=Megalurothrips usitatus TaxID=439358 RepID=A0AAV7XTH0_9NEOP|nr:hypothetical protein ONE63_007093 [Megalurothrips usitatus]
MADQWVRHFTVTDSRRHAKGFTVYKVTSTVFPRNAPEAKTEVIVWKRFKEFQKLYKDLKIRHEKLYLQDQFPLFCKPRIFGRFESDVIEERRLAAQALLDFTAKHPPLFTSQSCVKFFEKSQKVLINQEEDKSCREENLPAPLSPSLSREWNTQDTVSQSSSPSTLTDTDSVTSVLNSPLHMPQEAPTHSQDYCAVDGNASTLLTSPASYLKSTKEEECDFHDEQIPASHIENNMKMVCEKLCEDTVPLPESETQTLVGDEVEPSTAEPIFTGPSTHTSCSGMVEGSCHLSSDTHEDVLQSLIMDYITQAGYHIGQAVEHETNSNYELAFSSYKAAISCLLSGVQDDSSEDRKSLVQRKASQYLLRAEQIYHNHLDSSHTTTRTIPEITDIPPIPITASWKSLEAPVTDLKVYKVLGVVSSVILALNTRNDSPYIIKVLHKSPCPVDRRTKSIVPRNVPFMCQLSNFIETESAVFLILEQARGGRLWDHVDPYFQVHHSPESSRNPFVEFLAKCASENKSNIISNNSMSADKKREHAQSTILISNGSCTKLSSATCETGKNMPQCKTGDIPAVVIQEAETASASVLESLCDGCGEKSEVRSETENILKNSQKLLESVSKTLSQSEETVLCCKQTVLQTDLLNEHKHDCGNWDAGLKINDYNTSTHVQSISPQRTDPKCSSRDRISLLTRDHRRSVSRERKQSSTRHSRSRMRFSCDDMFEGRARALSRSLDREALHRVDPRNDQSSCIGLPVDTVRLWAAQLLLALDAVHRWGIVIGDLRPDNLLLGAGLNLVLTYQCQWVCVDHVVNPEAIEQLYAAPEISTIQAKTAAADWWSYGALIFELLSGETLYSCHPGGFHSYSSLNIPNHVCETGASLLQQILRFDAPSRLGVGPHGVAKLKAHPFFKGIEWNKVLLMSASV